MLPEVAPLETSSNLEAPVHFLLPFIVDPDAAQLSLEGCVTCLGGMSLVNPPISYHTQTGEECFVRLHLPPWP